MEPRNALLTGASQGLGLELARRLAADGWSLVIDAQDGHRLRSAADEIRSHGAFGTKVRAIAGDVADDVHRAALIDAASGLGPVDLVVNNASTLGTSPQPTLDDLETDVLRRILDVNTVAPLSLVRGLRRLLGVGATVVNVSSDAAVGAYPGWGGYGASKAALDHASRILAEEHPEWRVLSVDPGDMRTTMHQDAFPGEDISDRPPPDAAAAAILALVNSDAPSGRYVGSEVEA